MQTVNQQKRFLLVSIVPQKKTKDELLKDLEELSDLVDTFGGKVWDLVIQRREVHDKGMYIGRGKVKEIGEKIKEQAIDVVVLNALVKPGQLHAIKNMLLEHNPKIHVWDRIDLILEIFSKQAHTAEAKLQIELAQMRHMGPRIYGMGQVLSRQGGGIGTLGVGETNTELMKRHWRDQMKKTQERLQKLSIDRERQLARRHKIGLKTVSIVGYTNAGKTSLFNLLTQKKNYVENQLFATLDTTVGKVVLPQSKHEILVSDTIGFIKNLPANLVEAFRSTLLESIHADLLLHVIDISDPDMHRKIDTVEKVLSDLALFDKRRIYVFNKTDVKHGREEKFLREDYEDFDPKFISVKTGAGIPELLITIENELHDKPIEQLQTEKKVKQIHLD